MPSALSLESHVLDLERRDASEQEFKDKIHALLQSRCEVDFGTGCWVYTGCWEKSGIAKIRVGTRIYCVPRVAAWLYLRGFSLWDGQVVGRRCQTPACFNPDHLLIHLDQAQAIRRQNAAGRLGANHRHLSRAKVLRLRSAAENLTSAEMDVFINLFAAKEGISRRAIRAILDGRTWKEVGP